MFLHFYAVRSWILLAPEDLEQIYTPSLKIANLKSIKWGEIYGPSDLDYSFFALPHRLEYRIAFQAIVYCNFYFSDFPFDRHLCKFQIGSALFGYKREHLLPSILEINHKDILKYEDPPRRLFGDRLPFDIDIKVDNTLLIFEDGYNFSYAGFEIDFKRNTVGVLVGGFYLPTGLFSVLSLVSYTIHFSKVMFSIAN